MAGGRPLCADRPQVGRDRVVNGGDRLPLRAPRRESGRLARRGNRFVKTTEPAERLRESEMSSRELRLHGEGPLEAGGRSRVRVNRRSRAELRTSIVRDRGASELH